MLIDNLFLHKQSVISRTSLKKQKNYNPKKIKLYVYKRTDIFICFQYNVSFFNNSTSESRVTAYRKNIIMLLYLWNKKYKFEMLYFMRYRDTRLSREGHLFSCYIIFKLYLVSRPVMAQGHKRATVSTIGYGFDSHSRKLFS